MGMLRDTAPRRAIRQVLRQAGRPLSTQDVYGLARRLHGALGIATVYRTINCLLEEDWLKQLDVPGGGTYYELSGQPGHHHFQCKQCGKVFCTQCIPENVERLTPEGFHLSYHAVFLYGQCRDCSKATGDGAAARTSAPTD